MFFKKTGLKKNKRRSTYVRKGRAAGRKSSSVTAAVKKYVKRTISTSIENKTAQVNGGAIFGNVLESTDLNAYPMLPYIAYWSIATGLGQGGRVGNECKIKSLYLNYIITPRAYDALSNPTPVPCHIDLYLGHLRGTPNTIPVAADISQLYQSGSTTAAPAGRLRDLVSVINKDYWVIKKRWSHKCGFSNYGGTGSSAGNQSYANNDFKLNCMGKVNMTNMVNKTLKFNDGTATNLNKNLFFMYQAVSANGGVLPSTAILFDMEFWIDIQYEDA